MSKRIEREYHEIKLTLQASSTNYYTSEAFDFRPFAGGVVHMPATWTAATVSILAREPGAAGYQQLYKADATTLVQVGDGTNKPVASKSYALPAEIFAAGQCKLESQNGSGTQVDQTAARVLWLSLKG